MLRVSAVPRSNNLADFQRRNGMVEPDAEATSAWYRHSLPTLFGQPISIGKYPRHEKDAQLLPDEWVSERTHMGCGKHIAYST
jgi:hypothetical protein